MVVGSEDGAGLIWRFPPSILILMPMLGGAGCGDSSAEASVLGPGKSGRLFLCISLWACLLPSLLKEASGLMVDVIMFLSSSCGREPLPGTGSRRKYPS